MVVACAPDRECDRARPVARVEDHGRLALQPIRLHGVDGWCGLLLRCSRRVECNPTDVVAGMKVSAPEQVRPGQLCDDETALLILMIRCLDGALLPLSGPAHGCGVLLTPSTQHRNTETKHMGKDTLDERKGLIGTG